MTILRILTGSPAIAKEAARAIYLRGIYQATSSGVYVSTDAPRAVVDSAIANASKHATVTTVCTRTAEWESRIVRGVQQWRAFNLDFPALCTRWNKSRVRVEREFARQCAEYMAKRQTGDASHA